MRILPKTTESTTDVVIGKKKNLKDQSTYKLHWGKLAKYTLGWGVIKASLATKFSYGLAGCLSVLPTTILFGVGAALGDRYASKRSKNTEMGALIGGTILTSVCAPFEVPLKHWLENKLQTQPEQVKEQKQKTVSLFEQSVEDVVNAKPNTVAFSSGLHVAV